MGIPRVSSSSKGVNHNYQTNKSESRLWVRFVTRAEADKERKIRGRCCGYIPERLVAERQHDLCLMRLTNGRTF